MLRTNKQFSTDVSKLSKHHRVALACACAEHVLPLYERHYPQLSQRQSLGPCTNVRDTLHTIWRGAFGEDVPLSELQSADAVASASIPHIDIDDSIEAEMSMSAAVSVLEALDVLLEKPGAVPERPAFNAITAVTVACHAQHPNLPDEDPLLTEPTEREWEPLVHEWTLLNGILDELLQRAGDKRIDVNWKSEQAMQGQTLLKKLGWEK